MKYIILILLLVIPNCTINKVQKNHGSLLLEKKYNKITNLKTNKNDLLAILGPPSIISEFDDNLWIYVETNKTNSSIFKLGKRKLKKNNVLIVSLNDFGLVKEKELLDLNKMNDIKFSKDFTQKEFDNKSLISNLLTSLKQRMDAPVRQRKRN